MILPQQTFPKKKQSMTFSPFMKQDELTMILSFSLKTSGTS